LELFAGQKLKKMTLDKEEILWTAVRVYSPKILVKRTLGKAVFPKIKCTLKKVDSIVSSESTT